MALSAWVATSSVAFRVVATVGFLVVTASVAFSVGLSVVCTAGSVIGGRVRGIILGFLLRPRLPKQAEKKKFYIKILYISLHLMLDNFACSSKLFRCSSVVRALLRHRKHVGRNPAGGYLLYSQLFPARHV